MWHIQYKGFMHKVFEYQDKIIMNIYIYKKIIILYVYNQQH